MDGRMKMADLLSVFNALVHTCENTTSHDGVYNDETGEYFSFEKVYEVQRLLGEQAIDSQP